VGQLNIFCKRQLPTVLVYGLLSVELLFCPIDEGTLPEMIFVCKLMFTVKRPTKQTEASATFTKIWNGKCISKSYQVLEEKTSSQEEFR
jgi:hypothetical protein